jgi:hypothetical protein
MNEVQVNHLAVVVCAVINLAIGALWYSPALFFQAWAKEAEITEEKGKNAKPARNFFIAFVMSLVMSYNLAFFLGSPEITWKAGALYGFLTGFGWVSLSIGILAVFESRSLKYVLINGGFFTVWFTVIGLILAAWR